MPEVSGGSLSEATLKNIESQAFEKLAAVEGPDEVEELRVHFLGKKGRLTEILQGLKDVSPEKRKELGALANQIKTKLEQELKSRSDALQRRETDKALTQDRLDSSLPGIHVREGAEHPLLKAYREMIQIWRLAGLEPVFGPEVEFEDYCFDRLNFKPGHAARDMQATFFVKDPEQKRSLVLRTHTSPVQVRVLMKIAKEGQKLPIRVQVPGRVYRCDDDSTHSPMFHQIEGLAVDTTSTMGDLRAVLDFFFRRFFEDEKTKIRFRPSYFPFTEPSAEVDVSCVFCKGKGCRVCKQSGWLEVAGAGMVHPEVFKACGWDADKVQGWAFGMGVERMAMLKLGVPDLRLFFENRLSFLRGTPKESRS